MQKYYLNGLRKLKTIALSFPLTPNTMNATRYLINNAVDSTTDTGPEQMLTAYEIIIQFGNELSPEKLLETIDVYLDRCANASIV